MKTHIITLILVSILQFPLASQFQWKFGSDKVRQFNKSVITWRIDEFSRSSNLTKGDLAHVIRSATDTWADVIPVDFQQNFNASEEVDISIRFLVSDYDDISGLYLAGDELAHCFYTKPIRISFNGNVKFVIGKAYCNTTVDLFTVALHQLGHALGLRGHSTNPDSLIASGYTQRITELSGDVVREIQAMYGVRTGERPFRVHSPTASPATVAATTLSSANGPLLVNVPIELAILVDASASIENSTFQMVFDTVRKMPDSFNMSETAIRMAIIVFSDQARVLLGLTSDEQQVRNLKMPGDRRIPEPATMTNLALRAAKENVFKKARSDAHKIIYLITDGRPIKTLAGNDFEATEDVAAELRHDGVLIYIGMVGDGFENNAQVREHLSRVSTEGLSGVFAENSTRLARMVIDKLRKTWPPSQASTL